ncbi:hypothetical protein KIH79_12550, partial [Bifidobacterium sp. 82T10]
GSAGVCPYSDLYDPAFEQGDRLNTPLMDVHFYHAPEWTVMNAYRYENHPYHTKVFLGEYATLDDTWFNALAEAAFMTGLERAAGVALACYAPLFNNVKYTDWKPDMINYDGRTSYGTPSYYVQRLFSRNQGTSLLGTSDDVARGPRSQWSARGNASLNIINAPFTVSQLTITDLDHDGAVLQRESNVELTPDGVIKLPLNLGGTEHFRIDLDFTAHEKLDPESSGTDVTIRFAETGSDDYVALAINSWWGRMLTLRTYQHGKESYYSATHVNYAAETTHRALLEFDHGTVSLVMDGNPIFSETLLPYEPDDLYYSAVRDEDDTVTVKLVNVTDTPSDVRLTFDHEVKATYSIEHMDGFALDARNDLDHPALVSSSERTEHARIDAASTSALDYRVPAHAVHVLKFRLV